MFRKSRQGPVYEDDVEPSPYESAPAVAPVASDGPVTVVAQPAAVPSPAPVVVTTPPAPAHRAVEPRVVESRSERVVPAIVNPGAGFGLAGIGLLTLLLGAWAAIVPFVGPLFGFGATRTGAWVWNLPHALLWLAPGAVAAVLGLMMMSRAPLARRGLARLGHAWAGLIVACCGAWLAIGPFAWRIIKGNVPIKTAGPYHELLYWAGYSIGPGVLLGLLGGAALGIAMVTHRAAAEEAVSTTVARDQVAA